MDVTVFCGSTYIMFGLSILVNRCSMSTDKVECSCNFLPSLSGIADC